MTALLDQPGKLPELLARSSLEDGQSILRPEMTPRQAIDSLLGSGHSLDAMRLIARALPRREAVWWCCVCCRAVLTAPGDAEQLATLDIVERWVSTPSEVNRRACQTVSEEIGVGTPAGQSALAAFWSGGSLSLPKLPVVPPPEHLLPAAVANAVILAGVCVGPKNAPAAYARFGGFATDIAEGKNRWKEDRPPTGTAPRPTMRKP